MWLTHVDEGLLQAVYALASNEEIVRVPARSSVQKLTALTVVSIKNGGRQQRSWVSQYATGGESGIRTHGRVSPTHAFQACSFNHSDISPREWNQQFNVIGIVTKI